MIKIEKGVPIPEAGYGATRAEFPYRLMEVGDSFRVETEDREEQKRVYRNGYAWGRQHNRKFICRRDPTGIRVWRTE